MDQLIAKLTNLSYEFFGVILPGIVAALFLSIWWVAVGQAAPVWSLGFFPQLTSKNAATIVESISLKTGVGSAIPALVIAYFLGHILLWIARAGDPDDDAFKSAWRRVKRSLAFRIPKPKKSYDERLEPLFELVQAKFATEGTKLAWVQFYPVVKSYLSKNLTYSLVATYQNKYTLHRSITAAAAALFWLNVLTLLAGLASVAAGGPSPRWGFSLVVIAGAVAVVWGFSSSYMFHWKMFGNTIITEAYATIFGPRDARSKR